ncbi:unnamed protein product [Phytomonas sp. Hart1]|nr:unnamed protein product [Phytomonas sp. Hart1]|eukprot:CCW67137.1 unnamed protein product [Phytomonas sp. isolate Hart1]
MAQTKVYFDVEQLVDYIQNIAMDPEMRLAFVAEYVRSIKDLHGKNVQECEKAVSILFNCLESYDVMKSSNVDTIVELTVLDILFSLDLSVIQISLCDSYLGLCLGLVSDLTVAAAAAKTFGAALNFKISNDFIQTQVEEALKAIHLSIRQSKPKQVCSILALTEAALKYPVVILPRLDEILRRLWECLAHHDKEIRSHAEGLFHHATKLLANRPPSAREEVYMELIYTLKKKLGSKYYEDKIAGLLAFEPIVTNTAAGNRALRYEDLSLMLLPYIIGRDNPFFKIEELLKLVFRCLVVLCRFNKSLFVANHIKGTVKFALHAVKNKIQLSEALDMLTEIVLIVGRDEFAIFSKETCDVICDVLQESNTPCWEALKCFSVICKTSAPICLENYVDLCIEKSFRWGFSPQLIECMRDIIAASRPEYRTKLEESLLDMISITLCGSPFRHHSTTKNYPEFASDGEPSETQISVALNALVQFGFSNSELMSDFLRDSVLPMIDNKSVEIRNAAIYTITKLLIPSGERVDLSIARRICVNTVISRMLTVALSDPDHTVRYAIIRAFTEDFYPYLNEPQFLFQLYSMLGDESIDCHVAAVEQLCHMIKYNPSYILHVLRNEMVLFLGFISSECNLVTVQNGLRLLAAVSSKAPQFVVNFTESILEILETQVALGSTSSMLLQLLVCYTEFAKATHQFSKAPPPFKGEIARVCELFNSLPSEQSHHAVRLECLRFLSATLGPLVDGEIPYKTFPRLYPLLSSIIRSAEENIEIRLEALKCFGIIGAIDSRILQSLSIVNSETPSSASMDVFSQLTHQKCCRAVLHAISVLCDPTNNRPISSSVHERLLRMNMQTILNIADRCPCSRAEMSVIIAPLTKVICDLNSGRMLASIIYEYTNIIKFIGESVLRHAENIYCVFEDVWKKHPPYRFLVVRMLSVLTKFETSVSDNYRYHHTLALPRILSTLGHVDSPMDLKYAIIEYILRHIDILQGSCEAVISNLISVVQCPYTSLDFCNAAVATMKLVCSKLYVDALVGTIVRGLIECLTQDLARPNRNAALFTNVMAVFCLLYQDWQTDFVIYAAYIMQTLKTFSVVHSEFSSMNSQIISGMNCAKSENPFQTTSEELSNLFQKCESELIKSLTRQADVWSYSKLSEENKNNLNNMSSDNGKEKTLPISEQKILVYLKTTPLSKEDWMRCSEQFSLDLLLESPYQVFRCITLPISINAPPLTDKFPQFMQDVLHIAFRTLWTYSSANLRVAIVDFLRLTSRQAMVPSTVPDEVVEFLLGLVDYMEHVGEGLMLSYTDISDCAWYRGMFARSLFWREEAYRINPAGTAESLIALYSELRMVDSSVGILNHAPEAQRRIFLRSSLVKLARYAEALELIEQEMGATADSTTPTNFNNASSSPYPEFSSHNCLTPQQWNRTEENGDYSQLMHEFIETDHKLKLKTEFLLCLSELGDYNRVLKEWNELYKSYSEGSYDEGDSSILTRVSQYAADASIRVQSWDTLKCALEWIPHESVHHHISKAVLNIASNKYDEAMTAIKKGRTILLEYVSSALHESYLCAYDCFVVVQELTEMEESIIAKLWRKGLGTSEHIDTLAKRWDQRTRMMRPSAAVWKQVLGIRGLLIPPSKDIQNRTRLIQLCQQDNLRQMEKFTLDQLLGYSNPTYEQLTSQTANPIVVMHYISYLASNNALRKDTPYGEESDLIMKVVDVHTKASNSKLIARAYARLGKIVGFDEAIVCFKSATLYDPKWHLAWRMWAEMSSKVLDIQYNNEACINAIKGYIQSIQLGKSDSTFLQDVLKLLALWTRHCDEEHGLNTLESCVMDISTRVWKLVVPQLIAKLDSGSDRSCHLVANILTNVAYDYPQALLYPLNLCTMPDSDRRKKLANEIIKKLQARYPVIVLQGRLMANELIRISSLIYEQWYDKLESAANAFFGMNNKEEMIRTLLSIHETLERTPETIIEAEFIAKHSNCLNEAKEWVQSYKKTLNVADLHTAWNLYHSVYRMINEQIAASTCLKLPFCSPKLYEARDLAIGLPEPRPLQEERYFNISSFQEEILVIRSKQRPKRLVVTTVEGRTQKYLLKGQEDLRLDERVMQLFGLVNVLLQSDPRSCKNLGFQIQRYSVTPLKNTVGLIGWVEGCDTLHQLVQYYREKRNICVDLELRMLGQIITPDNPKAYDHLCMMSKVEVLEFLADHTSGQDLRRAMWAFTPSCETWLDQRTMFTSSLANMSMVGYILGLGDRHPNNLMVQRTSGLVIHIDFGDCFEVAMTRDRFPEKVPFRLTRMLRNALDVSGVEGVFRADAEVVMSVLREGRQNVLALLEAFIQDPLISWRLFNRPGQEPISSTEHKTIEEQVAIGRLNRLLSVAQDSISETVEGMGIGPNTMGIHHLGEEVDIVHQGVFMFNRVNSKLRGLDSLAGGTMKESDVHTQVSLLISQATNNVNVAQSWSGWYPFW